MVGELVCIINDYAKVNAELLNLLLQQKSLERSYYCSCCKVDADTDLLK